MGSSADPPAGATSTVIHTGNIFFESSVTFSSGMYVLIGSSRSGDSIYFMRISSNSSLNMTDASKYCPAVANLYSLPSGAICMYSTPERSQFMSGEPSSFTTIQLTLYTEPLASIFSSKAASYTPALSAETDVSFSSGNLGLTGTSCPLTGMPPDTLSMLRATFKGSISSGASTRTGMVQFLYSYLSFTMTTACICPSLTY